MSNSRGILPSSFSNNFANSGFHSTNSTKFVLFDWLFNFHPFIVFWNLELHIFWNLELHIFCHCHLIHYEHIRCHLNFNHKYLSFVHIVYFDNIIELGLYLFLISEIVLLKLFLRHPKIFSKQFIGQDIQNSENNFLSTSKKKSCIYQFGQYTFRQILICNDKMPH